MNKEYFKAYCKTLKIPFVLGNKAIDGRYKPYLSHLDNLYYERFDLYDAKIETINRFLETHTHKELLKELVN